MATSRDREERGRLQQPSNRRNRLPDLISVTMSDGSLVEINLTGANREEREDVAYTSTLIHTYPHTYIRTYVHTYIYIHTYMHKHWTNSRISNLPKQAKQICKHGVTSDWVGFLCAPGLALCLRAKPMEPRNTDSNRDVLFSSTEDSQQKAHITFTHTIFHAQLCHTHTHTYIHTYIRTYVHTYIRTYVRTYIHIHTYVHAYYLFTYFHTQSFTTSFVFPSFPVPARTFEAQYWKKLTCGVIRSFNLAIAEKTNWNYRNCQWLQSSERTMAHVQCQWF